MAGSQLGREVPNLAALLEVCKEEAPDYPLLRDSENPAVFLAVAVLADVAGRIGLAKEVTE